MPQGKVKFVISTAPKRPVRKPPQLMLAYSGPPIVETTAERIARVHQTVRARCAGYLTDDDLALVIKAKAKSGVKSAGK
jgi:hypothetical protein